MPKKERTLFLSNKKLGFTFKRGISTCVDRQIPEKLARPSYEKASYNNESEKLSY